MAEAERMNTLQIKKLISKEAGLMRHNGEMSPFFRKMLTHELKSAEIEYSFASDRYTPTQKVLLLLKNVNGGMKYKKWFECGVVYKTAKWLGHLAIGAAGIAAACFVAKSYYDDKTAAGINSAGRGFSYGGSGFEQAAASLTASGLAAAVCCIVYFCICKPFQKMLKRFSEWGEKKYSDEKTKTDKKIGELGRRVIEEIERSKNGSQADRM